MHKNKFAREFLGSSTYGKLKKNLNYLFQTVMK